MILKEVIVKKKTKFSFIGMIQGRCPACRSGKVIEGVFTIVKRCPNCGYDCYPEQGFYVGAIAVGFFFSALSTIPPMVILKFMEVDTELIVLFPFVEFLFVGTFLIFYSRLLWLHLEYQITSKLDERFGPDSDASGH